MGTSSSTTRDNNTSSLMNITQYLPVNTNIKLVFKTFNIDIGNEFYKHMTVPIYSSYIFQYNLQQYTSKADFSNTDVRNTIMFDYIHSDFVYDSDSITLSISNITTEGKSRIFTEKCGIISLNNLPGKIYDKKQNGGILYNAI